MLVYWSTSLRAISAAEIISNIADRADRISLSTAGVQGNANSGSPSISADGTRIAFRSLASNLVSDDTNSVDDIFLRDLLQGRTTRVSVSSLVNRRMGNPSTLILPQMGPQ